MRKNEHSKLDIWRNNLKNQPYIHPTFHLTQCHCSLCSDFVDFYLKTPSKPGIGAMYTGNIKRYSATFCLFLMLTNCYKSFRVQGMNIGYYKGYKC